MPEKMLLHRVDEVLLERYLILTSIIHINSTIPLWYDRKAHVLGQERGKWNYTVIGAGGGGALGRLPSLRMKGQEAKEGKWNGSAVKSYFSCVRGAEVPGLR